MSHLPRSTPLEAYWSASHTLGAVTSNHMPSQPSISLIPHPRQVEEQWQGMFQQSDMFFSVHLTHRHDCTYPGLVMSWEPLQLQLLKMNSAYSGGYADGGWGGVVMIRW